MGGGVEDAVDGLGPGEALQAELLLGGAQAALAEPGRKAAMGLGAEHDLAGPGDGLEPGGEVRGFAPYRDET